MTQIVWLRRDLRLADQAALTAAIASGEPVIPVYILDDETPKHRRMGGASRWWLHHSLVSLDTDLRKLGSRLILRRGNVCDVLPALVAETGATAVHCIRHYEPWWRNAERVLKDAVPLIKHHGNYLMPMGSVKTGSGGDFKIYTPFWRALSAHMPPPAPLPAPDHISAPDTWPVSDRLEDWALLPTKPDWAGGMRDFWEVGETAAHARLHDFLPRANRYDEDRNFPSITGTSLLSPHLHFGEITPAICWHAAMGAEGSVEIFLKELVWREYAQNVITIFPDYGVKNARDSFDALLWRDVDDPAVAAELTAWQQGRTGYPIVDAGMRQLWAPAGCTTACA
jgi:deoxyribodipyrimidine photo-lyase